MRDKNAGIFGKRGISIFKIGDDGDHLVHKLDRVTKCVDAGFSLVGLYNILE